MKIYDKEVVSGQQLKFRTQNLSLWLEQLALTWERRILKSRL
jgi:hypothetical protein